MADFYHLVGQPLQISSTGGIRLASGHEQVQQKVIRRLLTSGGDLLHDLTYGSGIPKMVGSPENEDYVRAIIKTQLGQEPLVQQNPAPQIGFFVDPATGTYMVTIRYIDSNTLDVNQVKIPVSTVVGR